MAEASVMIAGGEVFLVRGAVVMLDAHVASAFGVNTGRVNEAVSRNPAKFNASHSFRLTAEELSNLTSQSAISSGKHGGKRHLPAVFTIKGVARLATVLNSDAALQATDLIIDTFLAVQHQVASGQSLVQIDAPSRYRPVEPNPDDAKRRSRLASALDALLDTIIDVQNNQTLRDTGQEMSARLIDNVRERLRGKGLENAKLEADTALVLAQAEQVVAAVRKTHSESDGIDLDNLQKKIDLVKQLIALHKELEPVEFVQLLGAFDQAAPQLLQTPKLPQIRRLTKQPPAEKS
jgi:hypothetical protein